MEMWCNSSIEKPFSNSNKANLTKLHQDMRTSHALVEKESVRKMIFPREEVLQTTDSTLERKSMLDRATILSNLYHNKVKILFSDVEGSKVVDTTIWATTDHAIMLKGGIVIPIHRIHSIDLL
jgi:hypothetical protein